MQDEPVITPEQARQMLLEAQAKANRLLGELRKMQADALQTGSELPAEQQAAGREALASAVAAAERMLSALAAADGSDDQIQTDA